MNIFERLSIPRKIKLTDGFITKLTTYQSREYLLTKRMLDNLLKLTVVIINIGVRHPEFIIDNMPILEFSNKLGEDNKSIAEQLIEANQCVLGLLEEYDDIL
jgi:hypothetical protein